MVDSCHDPGTVNILLSTLFVEGMLHRYRQLCYLEELLELATCYCHHRYYSLPGLAVSLATCSNNNNYVQSYCGSQRQPQAESTTYAEVYQSKVSANCGEY